MRPATIVDNVVVIFPDGRTRNLTLVERIKNRFGRLKTVPVRNARHDTI